MADIINFPGDTRLDIHPDKILEGAVGELVDVLILGYNADGFFEVRSSGTNKADLLMMAELFKFKLMNGDFDE